MSEYVTGESNWRKLPKFETKPSTVYADGSRDTGGGYERIRSTEYRPHTPRQGKEDVYVSHHRLLAVVACYPEDMPVADILAHMDGKDVHHTTGVEWANFGDSPNFERSGIVVREHGGHAEITQAQIRAWGEDDKQRARAVERVETPADRCDGCGEAADVLAESADWEGVRCLDCAHEESEGAAIEL